MESDEDSYFSEVMEDLSSSLLLREKDWLLLELSSPLLLTAYTMSLASAGSERRVGGVTRGAG